MSGAWLACTCAAGCLFAGCGEHRPETRGSSPATGSSSSTHHARALGLTRRRPITYRRVCEQQAREAAPPARMCPPLVPSGPLKVLYSGRSLGRHSAAGGFSADLSSRSLDRLGRRRIETNGGHWRYDAAWTPAVRRTVVGLVKRPPNARERSSCRNVRVDGQEMEACRVVPHERGGGLDGGHIAYVWNHAGVTYVISVHGYANEPRARAMMTALAVQITARP